jgi:rhodanese-related sulfurtransferase
MQTITTDELKKRMDAGEQPHLLDVREDYERAEFNIGGKHIPMGKLQSMQLEDIEDWKNDEIIIYCRSGNRSGIAANMLEALGYNNVKNLVGGMLDWQRK